MENLEFNEYFLCQKNVVPVYRENKTETVEKIYEQQ